MTLDAMATVMMPMVPPARPTSIQGRRLPRREVVRSLSRPKKGLLTSANSEPAPVIRARLRGARSMPTSSLTLRASVTSSGARNSSAPPAYDNVYRAMKHGPTGADGERPAGSSAASGERSRAVMIPPGAPLASVRQPGLTIPPPWLGRHRSVAEDGCPDQDSHAVMGPRPPDELRPGPHRSRRVRTRTDARLIGRDQVARSATAASGGGPAPAVPASAPEHRRPAHAGRRTGRVRQDHTVGDLAGRRQLEAACLGVARRGRRRPVPVLGLRPRARWSGPSRVRQRRHWSSTGPDGNLSRPCWRD